jgi:hypothetical protein
MTTIIPDDGKENCPGWTRVSNWIHFFDLLQKKEKVWIRVLTRGDAFSQELEEVDICGSEKGYFIDPPDGVGGGWLHLMMHRSYPDLRKVLGTKSKFLENTAQELGLGL